MRGSFLGGVTLAAPSADGSWDATSAYDPDPDPDPGAASILVEVPEVDSEVEAWFRDDLRGVVWVEAVDGFLGEAEDFLCAAE